MASLGNPVFTVFSHPHSRSVLLVRYLDGTFDVLTRKDFEESFPDVDLESSGSFPSASKALSWAEDHVVMSDSSVDIFREMDGSVDEDHDDDEEDE